MGVPASVSCVGSFPTTRRICNCDSPSSISPIAAFGSGIESFLKLEHTVFNFEGYSGGYVDDTERTMFSHNLDNNANNGGESFRSS